MNKTSFINEFVEQVSQALPSQGNREELQKSIRMIAQSAMARLDIVTREEFDAQTAVLANTRRKLDALEADVKALSEQLD